MRRWAVLASLVALLALPASAQAVFPGQNGKIAFAKSGDIWTMNPDGTDQVNLTNDSASQGAPDWSADGSKLAFTQSGQIWTMLADGTGRTKLSDGTTSDSDPSWSPDDEKILFASCCPPGHDFTLDTMNADGTGRTHLRDNLDWLGQTDWASDGSMAWASEWKCPDGLYSNVFTTTFGYLTNVCSDDLSSGSPSWSPDAQRLAYFLDACNSCNQYSIHTIKRDRSDPQQLTTPPAGSYDYNPAWSPDGARIAFVRSGRIKVMNPDGTGVTDITDGTAPDWQPILLGYARPKGAATQRLSLTPAYTPCSSPNETHALPLADGSCNPPQQTSGYLTIGTPDANGKAANSVGVVKLTAVGELPINPNNGNQSDLQIDVSITDVRNASDLSDYTGGLRAQTNLRITDKQNSPVPSHNATLEDTSYGFTVPCAATIAAGIGATCSLQTSADTLTPGLVIEGKRAIWQLGQLKLYDGGADSDADTPGDNTLVETQGIFVP